MKPPKRGYALIQIILHWTIAAMIVFQLLVNSEMQDAFDTRLEQGLYPPQPGAMAHVIVGATILILAIIRVIVRLRLGVPPAHKDKPAVLMWVSSATHYALYGFLFFMPLTGAVAWFAGIELSGVLHEIGRLVLIPLIGLHVIGALAEHFVFRNDGLMRMLVPRR